MPRSVGRAAAELAADQPVAPALEARDLTLSWDGEHVVVQGVDVTVAPGEVCCLVGRSGCGKTTILHALAGLTTPMAGRVLLHGEDVTGRPGRVSYMLQKDLLLPSRRIIDNVCLPLVLSGMRRTEARAKAAPLFERFGLAGCELKWPSELSGGMRQRAAFLRTYLMGADVTLLDEPFSALDAITRVEVRHWFVDVVAELGLSALVITHDVDEAVSMASRVYVLAGSPAAGVPSRVVGEVAVTRPAGAPSFELTDEYLAAKREVMALLG
ncbi:ABC transporter ATP-binding protein [Thermophilibacter mediterraneus]|uniref:ABC transporter ATP-binding protein n=2 Tax=Thermophilibacter mediterraneus TaxID=1871031 RepID=UPI000931D91D|nr:ATP-binding cassette domain-containing protein [Thermophilibacter mediterraneus]